MRVLRRLLLIFRRLADTPFVSVLEIKLENNDGSEVLTRDMGRNLELGCHLRIHSNHLIRLDSSICISFLDLGSHPISEWLTDHGGAHIDEPLLRSSRDVGIVRQVVLDVGLLASECSDVLDGQVLILRNVDALDLAVLEPLFLHRYDVLELADNR